MARRSLLGAPFFFLVRLRQIEAFAINDQQFDSVGSDFSKAYSASRHFDLTYLNVKEASEFST